MDRPRKQPEIATDRLLLMRWLDRHHAPFAALNADEEVTRWLAGPMTRAESDAWIDACERAFDADGFGVWAVETRTDDDRPGDFVGAVGLKRPRAVLPFGPCVEILWRVRVPMQGFGYATEAARAALRYGLDDAGLEEIVSFTTASNTRSQNVMRKIGLERVEGGDFDHPSLPEGHPLRRHGLFRASAR